MRVRTIIGLLAIAVAMGGVTHASEEADEASGLLPNQIEVSEGVLAGGQPSSEQLEALREAGYRSVLNLRTDAEASETRAEVEALGMTYEQLPVAGADGLSEERARHFAELMDSMERPLVVHCASGNRVGALFALKAFYVDGMDAEASLEVGRRAGLTSLEAAVEEHLAAARTR